MTLDEWKIFLRGEYPTITDLQNGVERTLLPTDADYENYIASWAEASFNAEESAAGRELHATRREQVRSALSDLDSFADDLLNPEITLTVPQLRAMLARVCQIEAAHIRHYLKSD
jgi:hypothetical protein